MITKHIRPLATLAAATVALSTLLLPVASSRAQATFALSDGVGDATSGSYTAGSTFTLAVTFNSTVATAGYSLWFDTATANANRFSISSFTLTSASFPDATSGNGAQAFNTANAGRTGFLSNLRDLGATSTGGAAVAAGSYAVENVSFLIDPSAPVGTTYTFQTTPAASGGRASGGSNSDGSVFFNAPSATYTFTVVPEPSTWVMAVGGLGLLGLVQQRRRRTV